jgi:DNA-directed RNA polymerase specialized sigma24 family protein
MDKKQHYVDNKLFFAEMQKWKEEIAEQEEVDDLPPMVTEYMGECFYKIATHLSYRPNFINYTYREEMIGDGIENCIRYAKNFNPEKSKNPFAYFTQIIYYAFIRRITKEKKQTSIKQKIIDNTSTKTYDIMEGDDDVYSNTYMEFLRDNLEEKDIPKPKRKKSKKGIEHFLEEIENENEI